MATVFPEKIKIMAQLKPGTVLAIDKHNKYWIGHVNGGGILAFAAIPAILHEDPLDSHDPPT
jgi:hypothetical protein